VLKTFPDNAGDLSSFTAEVDRAHNHNISISNNVILISTILYNTRLPHYRFYLCTWRPDIMSTIHHVRGCGRRRVISSAAAVYLLTVLCRLTLYHRNTYIPWCKNLFEVLSYNIISARLATIYLFIPPNNTDTIIIILYYRYTVVYGPLYWRWLHENFWHAVTLLCVLLSIRIIIISPTYYRRRELIRTPINACQK